MAGPQNRTKTGERQRKPGTFQPGNRANPGGRPKVPPELREAAKSAAPEALQTAIDLMRNPGVEPADRLRAASIVLDRAYGKPVQATEISGPDGGAITMRTQGMTEAEKAALVRRVAGELKRGDDGPRPSR